MTDGPRTTLRSLAARPDSSSSGALTEPAAGLLVLWHDGHVRIHGDCELPAEQVSDVQRLLVTAVKQSVRQRTGQKTAGFAPDGEAKL